ncbi:MAG: amidohydrolase [Pseudomonadota bacterium]
MLTETDIAELTVLRRELHRRPEVSGAEKDTAAVIAEALHALRPDQVITGLGGHGIAAVFEGQHAGPTVMIRCELDGLPIKEDSDVAWASEVPGQGHLCGHDGHMAMVLGVGRVFAVQRPTCGRVVLLFQPAEEDGSGARAVAADPKFEAIAPDWAFAIHNLPGVRLGDVALRVGLMNPASQGLQIALFGKAAHAAAPETGISPGVVMAGLIPVLGALGDGGELTDTFSLSTVTHAQLGVPSFGIAPGDAVINVTLRAATDQALAEMVATAAGLARDAAAQAGLRVEITDHDVFAASVNGADAADVAVRALDAVGVTHSSAAVPMRASEDFGVFGHHAKAAMLCLGSGVDQPALHNPNFDFPDALIPVGKSIFPRIVGDLLG